MKEELLNFIKSVYNGEIIENDTTLMEDSTIDIYLPEKHIAFEYDDFANHNEMVIDKKFHRRKTEACEEHGVQLIHVFEDEWVYQTEITQSRIKGLLGLNERVYARKCKVKPIESKVSRQFLEENHIQGSSSDKYRYGLFKDNELMALMTFGKSRFADEFELIRYCGLRNKNIIGGASKLFKYFMNEHREIDKITSFADRRWSVGNLYKTIGFDFINKTEPAYQYIVNGVRHNRIEFQKHKLIKQGFDENKSEHEIMLDRGIYRIYDSGNIKFVYTRPPEEILLNNENPLDTIFE